MIEFDNDKFVKSKLYTLDEMERRFKGKLYGGYILAVDKGTIRAEVYHKGSVFYCFLWHAVPWSDTGWVRSGKCSTAEWAITDAILKAGYSHEELKYYDHGRLWLECIGRELGDNYRIFNFGWL